MPPLSELPDDLSREKFVKALNRLGFAIDYSGGKGSHCLAEWHRNHKVVTIKKELKKKTLYYLLKEIENISDITWEEIKKEL